MPGRRPRSISACLAQVRNVSGFTPTGADPMHRRVQRQLLLLLTSLEHKPHGPLPQLLRILPRCWHDSTFPWDQCLHKTRGASSINDPHLNGTTWGDDRREPGTTGIPGIDVFGGGSATGSGSGGGSFWDRNIPKFPNPIQGAGEYVTNWFGRTVGCSFGPCNNSGGITTVDHVRSSPDFQAGLAAAAVAVQVAADTYVPGGSASVECLTSHHRCGEAAVWVSAEIAIGGAAAALARRTGRVAGAARRVTPAPDSSTVYRVQGGVPPAASRARIGIGSSGEMTVSGDGMLFVTFDDLGRAEAFVSTNRPGASIVAFDVDPTFVTQVRNAAVPMRQAGNFPGAPQVADPLQTSGSFGLPSEWISRLQDAAIPGTGRVVD